MEGCEEFEFVSVKMEPQFTPQEFDFGTGKTDAEDKPQLTPQMTSKRSWAWEYFKKEPPNKVRCTICSKDIAHTMKSTTGMIRHLRLHNIDPTSPCMEKYSIVLQHSSATPEDIKYPENNQRQINLNAALVKLVTSDYQPASIVEDEGFIAFVSLLDPKYSIPSKKKLKSLINETYNKTVTSVQQHLSKLEHVSLTLDMWTSLDCESYMDITSHYITNNWSLRITSLQTFYFHETRTTQNIKEALDKVINDWGLTGKVTSIVADNKANITAAVQKLNNGDGGIMHITCLAHCLNSVVKNSLENNTVMSTIRGKAKKIVEYFKTSCCAKVKLFETQKLLKKPELKLIQESDMSWNSTYHMLETFYQQKECIAASLSAMGVALEHLTQDEWAVVEEAITLLRPFETVITDLSLEKHTMISKVLVINRQLQQILSNGSFMTSAVQKLEHDLLENLQKSLGLAEADSQFALTALLDPRFKKLSFLNSGNAKNAESQLTEKCAQILERNVTTRNANQFTSISPVNELDIWASFDREVRSANERHNVKAEAIVEVQRYLGEAFLERSKNPLEYWKCNENMYPTLAVLARKYLSIPATSVPWEQLSSKTGELISRKRNRLNGSQVNKIVFLHNNREEQNFNRYCDN